MSAREKWEYEVYRMNNVSESMVENLQRFGDLGWELVAVHPQPPHTHLIFKRKTIEQ